MSTTPPPDQSILDSDKALPPIPLVTANTTFKHQTSVPWRQQRRVHFAPPDEDQDYTCDVGAKGRDPQTSRMMRGITLPPSIVPAGVGGGGGDGDGVGQLQQYSMSGRARCRPLHEHSLPRDSNRDQFRTWPQAYHVPYEVRISAEAPESSSSCSSSSSSSSSSPPASSSNISNHHSTVPTPTYPPHTTNPPARSTTSSHGRRSRHRQRRQRRRRRIQAVSLAILIGTVATLGWTTVYIAILGLVAGAPLPGKAVGIVMGGAAMVFFGALPVLWRLRRGRPKMMTTNAKPAGGRAGGGGGELWTVGGAVAVVVLCCMLGALVFGIIFAEQGRRGRGFM